MTNKTKNLISLIESLPIDEKIMLVDRLLQNLHPENKIIDELWIEEAEKRVQELKEGKVKTIPADEVFDEIKKNITYKTKNIFSQLNDSNTNPICL